MEKGGGTRKVIWISSCFCLNLIWNLDLKDLLEMLKIQIRKLIFAVFVSWSTHLYTFLFIFFIFVLFLLNTFKINRPNWETKLSARTVAGRWLLAALHWPKLMWQVNKPPVGWSVSEPWWLVHIRSRVTPARQTTQKHANAPVLRAQRQADPP